MDALVEKLNVLMRSGTPAERRIARFFAENLADLKGETAASIADRLDLSPMTVGRFLRNLGYHAPHALKADLQAGDPAALDDTGLAAGTGDERPLSPSALIRSQIAAMASVESMTRRPQWQTAVQRLSRSGRVLVTASQPLGGLGHYMVDRLSAFRDGVRLVDGRPGSSLDLLDVGSQTALLVIIEFGRPVSRCRPLAALARKAGHEVLLLTDQPEDRTADPADCILAFPRAGEGMGEGAAALVLAIDLLVAGTGSASDDAHKERARRIGEIEDVLSDFNRG